MEESAIERKIETLPGKPGVYQFKDRSGSVIYVGKARNLRKRVRQYFSKSSPDSRFFTSYIRRNAADVEIIAARDEAEALILENNLIKEIRPKFNIRLRDDKDYLCIRVDLRSRWPRFELARRPARDGARYFGPFHSGAYAKELFRFLGRNLQLRTCSDKVLESRRRPCLQHQIGRCMAPCALPVDGDFYLKAVKDGVMLLEGRTEELREGLRMEMLERSGAMDYEAAARKRNLLRAMEALESRQRVVDVERVDTDAIGLAREMERLVITQLFLRRGKVVGTRSEKFSRLGSSDEETLRGFIHQYYGGDHCVPREILIDRPLPDGGFLEGLLMKEGKTRPRITAPKRGKSRELVAMAVENAASALAEWEKMEDASSSRMGYIASRLRLPRVPGRIECLDISHTSGKEIAGSLVVMESGELKKSKYRRFMVKADARGDDFIALREVLTRRLARGAGKQKGWELPDLLLVDGGKGHLGTAALVRDEMGIREMPVVAIAKDRAREERAAARLRVREKILEEEGAKVEKVPGKKGRGFDTLYVEGQKDGIPATRATPLGVLLRLRDEAHRFALSYHRKLRGKKAVSSILFEVKGVGPATVARLYKHFKGPDEIAAAGEEEIALKARISTSLAGEIKKKLVSGASRGLEKK